MANKVVKSRRRAVQELNGSTVVANLVTGLRIDEYRTRTDTSGASYFLADALGSTIALSDTVGGVPISYTYAPFGATSLSGSATSSAFDYTGREDDGTGLKYYRARYYSPVLHRFISEDPVGFKGGINLYAYARNHRERGVSERSSRRPDETSRHQDFNSGPSMRRDFLKRVSWTRHGTLPLCSARPSGVEAVVEKACLRDGLGGAWARTGLPAALGSATYNAANHQLTFGSTTLTYDLNGNVTSDGTKIYTWDVRNRLATISGGGNAASFQYDAQRRRTSKTVNSDVASPTAFFDALKALNDAGVDFGQHFPGQEP